MHADFIKISEIPALERVLKDRFNGQPPLQVLASNQIEAFLAQQPSRFHGLLDSDNTELLKNDVAIPPRIGEPQELFADCVEVFDDVSVVQESNPFSKLPFVDIRATLPLRCLRTIQPTMSRNFSLRGRPCSTHPAHSGLQP